MDTELTFVVNRDWLEEYKSLTKKALKVLSPPPTAAPVTSNFLFIVILRVYKNSEEVLLSVK